MESKSAHGVDVSIPADLESPRAKLVYLYVRTRGGATVEQLRENLHIKTGTVLSITGTLRDRGYLRRTDAGYEPV